MGERGLDGGGPGGLGTLGVDVRLELTWDQMALALKGMRSNWSEVTGYDRCAKTMTLAAARVTEQGKKKAGRPVGGCGGNRARDGAACPGVVLGAAPCG